MDGLVSRWKGACKQRRVSKSMDGWTDGGGLRGWVDYDIKIVLKQMYKQTNRWREGGSMGGCINEWVRRWIDGYIKGG